VQLPAVVHETVPWAAVGARVVTANASPLGSVSLASTLTDPAVPLGVESVTFTASGANTDAPPTLENANMNVLGVPSVGPSGVLGWPKE
jgi:hypothetical protein